MNGTMLWFNDVKDFGAITMENGDRISVHGTDFAPGERPKGRCAGAAVTFQVTSRDDEEIAEGVSFVPDVAPRRARMRHARFRSSG